MIAVFSNVDQLKQLMFPENYGGFMANPSEHFVVARYQGESSASQTTTTTTATDSSGEHELPTDVAPSASPSLFVSEFRRGVFTERDKITVSISSTLYDACAKIAWVAAQACPQSNRASNMYATVSEVSALRDGVEFVSLKRTYVVASVVEEAALDDYWNLFKKLGRTHREGIRVVVVRTISTPSFLLGPLSFGGGDGSRWMHDGRAESCVFAYSEEDRETGKRAILLQASPRSDCDAAGVKEIAVGTTWGDVLGGALWVSRVYVQNSTEACRTLCFPGDMFASWKTWDDLASQSKMRIHAFGRAIPVATYYDATACIRLPNLFACVKINGSRSTDHAYRLNTPHGIATDPAQLLPMLVALRKLCKNDEFCAIIAVPAIASSGVCTSNAFRHRFPTIRIVDPCGPHYAPIIATTFTRQSLIILANTSKQTRRSLLCAGQFGGGDTSVMYAACMQAFAYLHPYGTKQDAEAAILPTKVGTTCRSFVNLFFTGSRLWKPGEYSAFLEEREHERGTELLDGTCRDLLLT